MKKKYFSYFLSFILIFSAGCSNKDDTSNGASKLKQEKKLKKKIEIVIVMDTVDDWSSKIRDGFKETINKFLKENGSSANYTVYDTELKKEKAAKIVKAIKNKKPDLVCTINYPEPFADPMVTDKLKDTDIKFVSENCVPIHSGTIESWEKPGGNVTGVGVFIQMNSPIRLIKKINPAAKKLVFYSWDQMKLSNRWFKEEITRAAREEKIELVEFKTLKNHEDAMKFLSSYSRNSKEYFTMVGISVFVNEKGEFINAAKTEGEWVRKKMKIGSACFDEMDIRYGKLAGTCVIWYDIGAQLAEKGIDILEGANPGDIPWDYPRKFNIILNLQRAKDLNLTIPQPVINAAYRIYKDYKGTYIGHGK